MIVMLILLSMLEYRFWFGADSLFKTVKLRREIAAQEQEFAQLARRNRDLLSHVQQLKADHAAIEEQARNELGMVRKGEKYYQVVDSID